MLDHRAFAAFRFVLITGPQRSGTRIAARIIAHDLPHRYVDETEIHTDSLYALATLLAQTEGVIVQCPALCRDIHFFGDRDDVLIVMMMRDLLDIRASQDRVGWTGSWEPLEQFRYRVETNIADAKYHYWQESQRSRIKNWLELRYEDLSGHSLWIPKERRVGFEATQTEER